MAETELDLYPARERRLHLDWVLPALFRPRTTFARILAADKPVWLTPLLLVSLLAVASILIAGSLKAELALQGVPPEPPEAFQWWTPEMQQAYSDAIARQNGPLFTHALPALGAVLGVWFIWVLFSSLLHLGLTLAGSRSSAQTTMNLVAWATLPLALRYIVQGGYMLIQNQLVSAPGLSGFLVISEPGFPLYLKFMLAAVDLYALWRLGLILYGVLPMSGLPRTRAWLVTLVVFLLVLGLQALPGFLSARLSGMEMIRPFMF